MNRNATALLAAFAFVGYAQGLSAQERIATNDTYNEFPRWHMLVNAFNQKDGGGNRVLPGHVSMAQDFKNVLHIGGTLAVSGGGNQVYYINNSWLSRRANGFSSPEPLSLLSSGQSAHDVEVAALSDGRIVVLWCQPGAAGEDIRWRERSAAGTWGSISTGIAGSSGTTFTNLRAMSRGTDIHLVFVRTNASSVKLEYVMPTSSWTTEVVSDSAVTSANAAGANVVMNGSGNLFVVYEDYPTLGGEYARYRSKPSGGSWSSATDIRQSGYSPDVSIDSSGNAHIVHIAGSGADTGKVFHRVGIGGADVHVGNTTAATAAFDRARIAVDSRNRPNVLWNTTADVGYAVKIASTWTRQEPTLEPGRGSLGSGRGTTNWSLGSLDMIMSPSDGITWIDETSGLVSWTFEPNLGTQDNPAMFAIGPKACGNAMTGNLILQLPLFSSDGVGFATKLNLFHNSLEPDWGVLSNGWGHSYHIYIVDGATASSTSQDSITFVSSDGRRVIFRYDAAAGYHIADAEYGIFSTLERLSESSSTEWVHSKYRLTTKRGMTLYFRGDGKLEQKEDTNSNTIDFHYAGDSGYSVDSTHPQGALVEIEDSLKNLITSQAGRKTLLTYNSDGQIATVRDPQAATANYSMAYDANKRLADVGFLGVSGVHMTFSYHTSNNAAQGERLGFLDFVCTPRGSGAATPFGTSYLWYQDNRIWHSIDPEVSVVTTETSDSAPVSALPQRVFEYSDPTGSFGSPNANPPGQNAVPFTTFIDRRGYETIIEYQYRRALVDNVTDPQGKCEIFSYDGTYRNFTSRKDKRGVETKYTYHSSATPSHVKDNCWKLERSNSDGSGFLTPMEFTYTTDGQNRLASFKNARGHTTNYSYSAAGNLTSITHPTVNLVDGTTQSASESFTYTSRGRLQTHTNPEGGVRTYHYDDDDDTGLVTKVQEDGQVSTDARTYEYYKMGVLKKFTASPNNQAGGVTEIIRDGLYRVAKVKDPLLEEITYAYDANSNMTSMTNRRGKSLSHQYNARDERTSTTLPYGNGSTATATSVYDRDGNPRREVNYRGYTTKRICDSLGRMVEIRRPGAGMGGGGGPAEHETEYEYDANGNMTKVTSVSSTNRVTTFTYDARNNRTRITYPVGNLKDEFVYDANDNLLALNRLDGSTFKGGSAAVFDERNRAIKRVQLDSTYSSGTPSGPTFKILHDKNALVTQVWNPNATSFGSANSKAFTYDDRLRLSQIKDGAGTVVQETQYYEDDSVQLVKVQQPAPSAGGLITIGQYEYSNRCELTCFTDSQSYEWAFEYDDDCNRTKCTDPELVETQFAYDDANRLKTRTFDPSGLNIVSAYSYDPHGNLLSTTLYNPSTGLNDAVYSCTYDQADRPEKLINPDTSNYQLWTYNDHCEVATHRDANGKTATLTYDALGRVTSEAHGTPYGVTRTRQYYGATGLATQVTDGTRTVDNMYNTLGHLTSSSWSVSGSAFKSVSYAYDDAGNCKEVVDPEGPISGYSYTYKYEYDSDNRLSKAKRGGSDEAVYQYDASGRVKEVTLGNGSKTTLQYTSRYQTSKVKTATSGGTTRAEYSYTYDSRRRCSQQIRNHLGETIDYNYDNAGRLTEESSTGSTGSPPISVPARLITWAYNKRGNRTSQSTGGGFMATTSYIYNSEGRLTLESLTNGDKYEYVHDSNGNRTHRKFTPNGQSTPTVIESFGYDFANRQSSYVKTSGSSTLTNFAYSYVPTGQRLSKTDNSAGTKEWFMYVGRMVTTEYTQIGTGTLSHKISYVNSGCMKLARVTIAGGAAHYYVPDALGSLTHLLDSTQAIVNSEVTDAWGNVIASSYTITDRYGFCQGRSDPESGLLQFPPGGYDPLTGISNGDGGNGGQDGGVDPDDWDGEMMCSPPNQDDGPDKKKKKKKKGRRPGQPPAPGSGRRGSGSQNDGSFADGDLGEFGDDGEEAQEGGGAADPWPDLIFRLKEDWPWSDKGDTGSLEAEIGLDDNIDLILKAWAFNSDAFDMGGLTATLKESIGLDDSVLELAETLGYTSQFALDAQDFLHGNVFDSQEQVLTNVPSEVIYGLSSKLTTPLASGENASLSMSLGAGYDNISGGNLNATLSANLNNLLSAQGSSWGLQTSAAYVVQFGGGSQFNDNNLTSGYANFTLGLTFSTPGGINSSFGIWANTGAYEGIGVGPQMGIYMNVGSLISR